LVSHPRALWENERGLRPPTNVVFPLLVSAEVIRAFDYAVVGFPERQPFGDRATTLVLCRQGLLSRWPHQQWDCLASLPSAEGLGWLRTKSSFAVSVRAPPPPERPTYTVFGSGGGVGNAPSYNPSARGLGRAPSYYPGARGLGVPRAPIKVLEGLAVWIWDVRFPGILSGSSFSLSRPFLSGELCAWWAKR